MSNMDGGKSMVSPSFGITIQNVPTEIAAWSIDRIFARGSFLIQCPRVLEENELEMFDLMLDLCRQQVHRWSKEAAEQAGRRRKVVSMVADFAKEQDESQSKKDEK
jgi:hypothetical protein